MEKFTRDGQKDNTADERFELCFDWDQKCFLLTS